MHSLLLRFVCILGGLFLYAASLHAAPQPKVEPIPKETEKAWRACGAWLTWQGHDRYGYPSSLTKDPEKYADSIPLFVFDDVRSDAGVLPKINRPYGIATPTEAAHKNWQIILPDPENVISLRLRTSPSDKDSSEEILARAKQFKALTHLEIEFGKADSKAERSGIGHLSEMKNLTHLTIEFDGLKNDDLIHLKELKNLKCLFLRSTQLTEEGLVHLKNLGNLSLLSTDIELSAAGFKHLKELKSLSRLTWNDLDMADELMVDLAGLKNLTYLNLRSGKITDRGLAHLKDLKNLNELIIRSKKVTDTGCNELLEVLPKCKIER